MSARVDELKLALEDTRTRADTHLVSVTVSAPIKVFAFMALLAGSPETLANKLDGFRDRDAVAQAAPDALR